MFQNNIICVIHFIIIMQITTAYCFFQSLHIIFYPFTNYYIELIDI